MKRFSWLQGRCPETGEGNRFCCMKRGTAGPNKVGQTLKNLAPNQVYSLKLISANYGQMDMNAAATLDIAFDGAEMEKTGSHEFVYPKTVDHSAGQSPEDRPAWFTWRRVNFIPIREEAELTIPDEPAPPGRETACNFVEVQPAWND